MWFSFSLVLYLLAHFTPVSLRLFSRQLFFSHLMLPRGFDFDCLVFFTCLVRVWPRHAFAGNRIKRFLGRPVLCLEHVRVQVLLGPDGGPVLM